jgi:ribokinase
MDTVMFCPALPGNDGFQMIKSEQVLPGGSCANMLTTLASLGAESRLIAKIGDDELGRLFRRTLAQDGVDGSLLITKPGGTTLHTYVLAADNGQHCIMINMGDSLMALKPEELDTSMLDGAAAFYSDLFPGEAAVYAAGLCRERNIPVIICMECPPSFMEMTGVSRDSMLEALSLADLIISGREGYQQLAGVNDYRQALAAVYQRFTPRLGAICTAGDEGAVWQDSEEILRQAAYSITPVDSTGAGDSFLGALIYSYFIDGNDIAATLKFAAAVGAMKCLRLGPRMKTSPQEVEDFIRQHNP